MMQESLKLEFYCDKCFVNIFEMDLYKDSNFLAYDLDRVSKLCNNCHEEDFQKEVRLEMAKLVAEAQISEIRETLKNNLYLDLMFFAFILTVIIGVIIVLIKLI